ncbi:MAG: hypothetical protein QF441_16135 [Bacteriovoracaceae bacterium]|nr:hypothetical protein [Bacteriovoracaceae bacterium]
MADRIFKLLSISYYEINIKRSDIYEYNAFIESFGFNVRITSGFVELDFMGAFYSFSGKEIKDLYEKSWVIIRLCQRLLEVPPLICQIDIAVDMMNFNLKDYYEFDFNQNKTLFPKKTLATALKDGENNFQGTITYKFPNSSGELVLYMKGREIQEYEKKIKNGRGGLKTKLEKYQEMGYFDIDKNELTRAELRLKRRAIKENYQTLIFTERNLDKLLQEILSHFYKNRRVYYNPTGQRQKEWRLKEKSKHFEEHIFFRSIFLQNNEFKKLSVETPSGHILKSKNLKTQLDFDEALINLIYQYCVDDNYLNSMKLEKLTLKLIYNADVIADKLKTRRERIRHSWAYLEELSKQFDDN